MARHRIAAAQQAPMKLRDLLAADALQLLTANRDAGLIFYTQSWALLRFLGLPDQPWCERLEQWEANCRGAVLGAQPGIRIGDATPARVLFDRLFGADLDAIEAAFAAWFAAL